MTKTEAYEHMKVQYNTHLNMKKVTKALEKAKKSREGSEKEQYGKIRQYLSELLRSNPGSTCGLQVLPQTVPQAPPVFNRMYIHTSYPQSDLPEKYTMREVNMGTLKLWHPKNALFGFL
ncbi:hypothetical protein K1719_038385 [Acacia pycnantha]|nr:hypothetical protein K1719_038385 [Acacia pycnantha]